MEAKEVLTGELRVARPQVCAVMAPVAGLTFAEAPPALPVPLALGRAYLLCCHLTQIAC